MGDWREGYKRDLMRVVLEKGSPMRMEGDRGWGGPRLNYYGWHDNELDQHFRPEDQRWMSGRRAGKEHNWPPDGCTPVATEGATVTEESYDQFQGTFYEGDEKQAFIVVHPVACACGYVKEVYWGYEGSLSDVISNLLRDEW